MPTLCFLGREEERWGDLRRETFEQMSRKEFGTWKRQFSSTSLEVLISPDIRKGSTTVCSWLWREGLLGLAHLLKQLLILIWIGIYPWFFVDLIVYAGGYTLQVHTHLSRFLFLLSFSCLLLASTLCLLHLLRVPSNCTCGASMPIAWFCVFPCFSKIPFDFNHLLLKPALFLCLLQGDLSLLISQLGLLHHIKVSRSIADCQTLPPMFSWKVCLALFSYLESFLLLVFHPIPLSSLLLLSLLHWQLALVRFPCKCQFQKIELTVKHLPAERRADMNSSKMTFPWMTWNVQ